MSGFEVALSTGVTRRIEADRYGITDDGMIQFSGGHSVLEQLDAAHCVRIVEIGTRLGATWPSERLVLVIDSVAERLGLHYTAVTCAVSEM